MALRRPFAPTAQSSKALRGPFSGYFGNSCRAEMSASASNQMSAHDASHRPKSILLGQGRVPCVFTGVSPAFLSPNRLTFLGPIKYQLRLSARLKMSRASHGIFRPSLAFFVIARCCAPSQFGLAPFAGRHQGAPESITKRPLGCYAPPTR